MRFWLAVLFLFGGCAVAVLWQTRWTQRLRSERDLAWAGSTFPALDAAGPPAATLPLERASSPAPHRDDGPWARVVVGRPSGAEPVTPPLADRGDAPHGARGGEPLEPDFTTTVRPGQSLSIICQQHYGSARRELVQALAAYNGLDDPDRIRVGSRILLPAQERLLAGR